MLSEEEKKAVEKLKKIRQDTIKANKCGLSNNDFKEEIEVYDVVLNLITRLEKENEEKDKQIDIIIDELYKKMKISTNCYIQKRSGIEQCLNYKNCKECLKKYFENKAKEE